MKKAAEMFKDIMHRFGLPNDIINDLGSTFTSNDFRDFCEDQCISIKYVSVAHRRANGQVEWANDIDEILTYGYVKPRVQWFSKEEDPRPTPPGSPGGSGAIPIGYARAHPLEKKPYRA